MQCHHNFIAFSTDFLTWESANATHLVSPTSCTGVLSTVKAVSSQNWQGHSVANSGTLGLASSLLMSTAFLCYAQNLTSKHVNEDGDDMP